MPISEANNFEKQNLLLIIDDENKIIVICLCCFYEEYNVLKGKTKSFQYEQHIYIYIVVFNHLY